MLWAEILQHNPCRKLKIEPLFTAPEFMQTYKDLTGNILSSYIWQAATYDYTEYMFFKEVD